MKQHQAVIESLKKRGWLVAEDYLTPGRQIGYPLGCWPGELKRRNMTVTAEKAISFQCEQCGFWQYEDYSLEEGWFEGRAVMEDTISCEGCGHDNHVIEEM